MSPRPAPRRVVFQRGRRGASVRVVVATHRGAGVFLCEFHDRTGARRRAYFPRSRDGRAQALAFAEGAWVELQRPAAPAAPLTVRALMDRFAEEHLTGCRPSTVRLHRDAWRHLLLHVGGHTPAHLVTRDTMVELRRRLEDPRRPGGPLGVSTLAHLFGFLRQLFRWGEDANLLPASTVPRYVFRVAKEQRPAARAEYRREDWERIVAAVAAWRPRLALILIGQQGVRQHAALHLRWEDVDWANGTLTWRARWDKVGREWSQPMRRITRDALEVAWTAAGRPVEGWVLPGQDPARPFTIQSLWWSLRRAETEAGVARVRGRAGHGFRRMLAGDVLEATGDAKLALDAIGDKDIRQAERYLQRRDDRVRRAFAQLDGEEVGDDLATRRDAATTEGSD